MMKKIKKYRVENGPIAFIDDSMKADTIPEVSKEPNHIPNETTAKTLWKSRQSEDVETFDTPDEMFASWEE